MLFRDDTHVQPAQELGGSVGVSHIYHKCATRLVSLVSQITRKCVGIVSHVYHTWVTSTIHRVLGRSVGVSHITPCADNNA